MTETQQYSGFIAIVGRPNVGKSTLLNQLLGQKVSITSKKAQTTRHRIMGIHTKGPYQAIYVDTPGLHQVEKRAINRLMNRAASSSLGDVDLVLFVVDGTSWQDDDALVLRKLQRVTAPVVLLLNKVDLIRDKGSLLPHIEWLSQQYDFADIVPLSARRPQDVEPLHDLVRQHLRPGIHYFPEDYVTDRSLRFVAAEIVREKLMRLTGDELPYSTTVEIEVFREQDNGTTLIHALILVERETQKRMVIGKQGQKLKTVGQEARKDLEGLLAGKVNLQLWVKVKAGWSDDDRALRSLGYGDD